MEGREISVLALDLDGTIVTHDYRMSDRTVEAVSRFKAAGGEVLIASGRPARSARSWAVRLGGVAGMINHNGAGVYAPLDGLPAIGLQAPSSSSGDATSPAAPDYRLVASSPLPAAVCERLVELSRGMDIHFHVLDGDNYRYERILSGHAIYEGRAGFPGIETDFRRAGYAGYLKAMFVDKPGPAMEALAARLRELLADTAQVMFTSPGFLEIVAPGVSKAVGLAGWLSARGKDLGHVLAIGDAENDEAMLLAAGIGVAMGNAPAALKAKVGRVTGSIDEDGAATIIEALVDGRS